MIERPGDDQFILFTNRAGETVRVPKRGKHYVEPRGYFYMPGTGPESTTCQQCAHYCGRGRFPKCGLNKARWTHGRATDILARSPSCKYFEAPGAGQ